MRNAGFVPSTVSYVPKPCSIKAANGHLGFKGLGFRVRALPCLAVLGSFISVPNARKGALVWSSKDTGDPRT